MRALHSCCRLSALLHALTILIGDIGQDHSSIQGAADSVGSVDSSISTYIAAHASLWHRTSCGVTWHILVMLRASIPAECSNKTQIVES